MAWSEEEYDNILQSCESCYFYDRNYGTVPKCNSPFAKLKSINPVSGKPYVVYCDDERLRGNCGVEGKNWKPKPEPSLFQRLLPVVFGFVFFGSPIIFFALCIYYWSPQP